MPEDADTLSDAIVAAAQKAKTDVVAGMGSTEAHPLQDQIAVAKFIGPPSAIKKRVGAGIRFIQATPGGSA